MARGEPILWSSLSGSLRIYHWNRGRRPRYMSLCAGRFLISKHLSSVIWPTRKVGVYPQTYVRTRDAESLHISHFYTEDSGEWPCSFTLTRGEARLLARRITQCLEASK